jgi:hypothetical protein
MSGAKGMGVIALETIESNTLVCEYIGAFSSPFRLRSPSPQHAPLLIAKVQKEGHRGPLHCSQGADTAQELSV